jgi:hypothetical protein
MAKLVLTASLSIALLLALACSKGPSSPSNASDEDDERGVTNTQPSQKPSLGSYGTGDDGTNGGAFDPGAVGAGVSNPIGAGTTKARAPDAGAR